LLEPNSLIDDEKLPNHLAIDLVPTMPRGTHRRQAMAVPAFTSEKQTTNSQVCRGNFLWQGRKDSIGFFSPNKSGTISL
jgi:hypothetical protein